MNNNVAKIKEIILKKLATEFDVMRVIDVRVREDLDADGSRVLLIDVVFEGERKAIDAKALTSAVRKLRPALIENNEDAFPVFSFIAGREMNALAREAR